MAHTPVNRILLGAVAPVLIYDIRGLHNLAWHNHTPTELHWRNSS